MAATSSSPLSYVPSVDSSINEARLREFSDVMMANAQGTYDLPVQEITSTTDNKTYAGYGIKDVVELDNLFTKHIQKYLNETNNLILMNDVIASNEYLNETMENEFQRAAQVSDKTKNNIYKTRASYMLKKYQVAYNNFVSGILQFTLFVFVVLGVLVAAWRQSLESDQPISFWLSSTMLIAYAIILVVLYLIIVVLLYKTYQTRRKDDWDKFYFASMEGRRK